VGIFKYFVLFLVVIVVGMVSWSKADAEKLLDDPLVKGWIDAVDKFRSGSPATRKNYLLSMSLFVKLSKLLPGVIVQKSGSEIKTALIDVSRSLTKSTAQSVITAVRSFLKYTAPERVPQMGPISVDVDISPIALESRRAGIPKDEDFARLLNHCSSLRDRIILLFLRQSGVRIGALAELQLRDLLDLDLPTLKFKRTPCALNVYRGSSENYYTFIGPDVCMLIEEYLKGRRNRSKFNELLGPESPVFIKEERRRMKLGIRVSRGTIQNFFLDLNKRAGIDPPFSAHSLRSLFQNLLERVNIQQTRVEALMGHSQGIKDHYSIVGRQKKSPQQILQRIEELRAEYSKAQAVLMFRVTVPLDLDEVRLQMVKDFAKSIGVDIGKLQLNHRSMTPAELKELKPGIQPYPEVFLTTAEKIETIQKAIQATLNSRYKIRRSPRRRRPQ